jgi:hypothetical protein
MKMKIERVQLYNDKDFNRGELVKMDNDWQWESLEGHHRYTSTELIEIAKLAKDASDGKLIFNKVGKSL